MPEPASGRFLALYALAWAGVVIAYVPFLTILLPVQVAALAGRQDGIEWLALLSFCGAGAASIGHIAFGWLSDITGNRRGWMALGLAASSLLLVAAGSASSLPALIGLIICWQMALNMMMAPLAALAGDRVSDDRKGLLGGLLAFAPGCGALSATLVTLPGLVPVAARPLLVAVLVAACVLPILFMSLPALVQAPASPPVQPAGPPPPPPMMRRMWVARLAVQIAEATLFAYLYFWFRSVDPAMTDNRTAAVFTAVLLLSAPLALAAGRRADRSGHPFRPLVTSAVISALGLVAMAASTSLVTAIAAYALFGLASQAFLALHSAQTLRVLPRPDRRGRDLGVFNLTNTIPSLIMPWLTLGMVPRFGFSGLFLLLSPLSLAGGLVLAGGLRRARGRA